MASDPFQIIKLPLEASSRGRGLRVAAVAGLTLLACAPSVLLMVRDHAARAAATDAFWRVEGRPCAPLSAERFHDVQRPPSVTAYDGAVYARHGGAMLCTHRAKTIDGVAVRYPVCKFDSPDYLGVTVAGQERFYDLTMGRSAAVGVVNGQVRCVVTPGFGM